MRNVGFAALIFLCSLTLSTLAQTPNDPGEPGVIIGRVVDSTGRAVQDAKVYVREHDKPQMGAVHYFTTDQRGQFRIENLRPGDYDVYAVPAQSTSMLTHWRQRVHLRKERPLGKITIQIDTFMSHSS